MISQTTEYALRAMVHLANGQAADGRVSQTAQQIAAGTKVPLGYLSKVLQSLSRGGLIRSQRGLGGGFSLSREASEISVYEIVQLVDPLKRIHSCPLGLDAHRHALCPLHAKLDGAMALVENSFRKTSIADLIEGNVPADFAAKGAEPEVELPIALPNRIENATLEGLPE
ncbi:MAG: RrF2 family transcriptional regulator [Candidatus Sericytochromatia bacterium]